MIAAGLVALVLAALLVAIADRDDETVVETRLGSVRGVREQGSLAWKGIPYAEPPTGPHRWQPPRPVRAWLPAVLDAGTVGSPCLQVGPERLMAAPATGSEDCLFLNVWRPEERPDALLPVLVYVHGGAGITGSGSDWSGARLSVAGSVIVVTFNHRLGPLGFLAHPDLTADQPQAPTNFGVLDQLAALEWVQSNIDVFGGDPDRVMVFGHSAGGHFVSALLASPLAAGQFSSAAVQSGSPVALDMDAAERDGVHLAEELGCIGENSLKCLRAADPIHVVTAGQRVRDGAGGYRYTSWGAVVDGVVIGDDIVPTLAEGKHNRVPLIVGTTAVEYLPGQILEPSKVEDLDVRQSLSWLGNHLEEALQFYPAAKFKDARHQLAAVISDRDIVCPSLRLADAAAGSQPGEVWRYVFSHGFDLYPASVPGVHHGIDRYFLFPDPSGLRHLSEREENLSQVMIRYWSRFAATGSPNGEPDPEWPTSDDPGQPFMVFDTSASVAAGSRPPSCAFWDRLADHP